MEDRADALTIEEFIGGLSLPFTSVEAIARARDHLWITTGGLHRVEPSLHAARFPKSSGHRVKAMTTMTGMSESTAEISPLKDNRIRQGIRSGQIPHPYLGQLTCANGR
jgi:hypothetical protein